MNASALSEKNPPLVHTYHNSTNIVCSDLKVTKVISKILFMKSSKNYFIFLPAFYLVMCLMKAPNNF
jgi:hypothetical protein